MKDVLGENVETIVSYLKGSLIMLANYNKLPTDTMDLLKDIFCSADCDKFMAFMPSV